MNLIIQYGILFLRWFYSRMLLLTMLFLVKTKRNDKIIRTLQNKLRLYGIEKTYKELADPNSYFEAE